MIELNKSIKTKSGETLMPYLIQNDMVHCFNSNKETVVKKLDDFIVKKTKSKKIVNVIPITIEKKETVVEDPLINPEIAEETIKEIEEEIETIKEPVIVKPEPVIVKPIIPVVESKDKIESKSSVGNSYLEDEDYI
jgi:hypothetical protein